MAYDPIKKIKETIARAERAGDEFANAAVLATVGEGRQPAARMLLITRVAQDGLVFYTNLNSRKARELTAKPNFKFPSPLSSRRLISLALRVAASIIIAVGVGAMSGVNSASKALSTDSTVWREPDYLAALSLQWSSDLNWSVLEEHAPDSEVDE